MGFFDKLKGAMNAVTGGAAKVTVEFHPPVAFAGDVIGVRITATSTGADCKGDGIWIDLKGVEEVKLARSMVPHLNLQQDIVTSRPTFEQSFKISGPFMIPAGQTQMWEGQIQIPGNAQPTFDGNICDHGWGIRGRLEMFGNDPDSGFVPYRVGLRG